MDTAVLHTIIKNFFWLASALCWGILGCASPAQTSDSALLGTAKRVYTDVADIRGNPQEDLVRQDWPPESYKGVENVYLYSLPYLPYVFYDSFCVYLKECILLPTWLITGGTQFQDDADARVAYYGIYYRDVYRAFWPNENSQANYINMDEWPQEKRD